MLDETLRAAIMEWKPPLKAEIEEEDGSLLPIVHRFK